VATLPTYAIEIIDQFAVINFLIAQGCQHVKTFFFFFWTSLGGQNTCNFKQKVTKSNVN